MPRKILKESYQITCKAGLTWVPFPSSLPSMNQEGKFIFHVVHPGKSDLFSHCRECKLADETTFEEGKMVKRCTVEGTVIIEEKDKNWLDKISEKTSGYDSYDFCE